MRFAVVTDIHGNLTALEAVIADLQRRGVERVVHGGDVALMGPRPAAVIERIASLGWDGVVGNTDELLWRPDEHDRQLARAPKLAPLLRLLFDVYAPLTRRMLTDDHVTWLQRLPAELRIGGWAIVHAGPGDLWRAPTPSAGDAALRETYEPLAAPAAVYGHIHRPFVRRPSPDLLVVNAGSVGMPWDGDPRAAYLLVEEATPRIVRVAYDLDRETAAMTAARHPDADRLDAMRRQGAFIAPR
jgi:diadenosine tetraphosphatase ApaH/serine/threonine PP2A family protein phosphatase